MSAPDAAAPRAARLLRWYPKAWRSRYGEEFTELLISDIGERPRSRSRTADVIRGGMVARLADAGLCGCAPEAAAQVRASLASLACCAAVFLGFGGAMWSQLTIGWQWSAPTSATTSLAMYVMSGSMLVFACLLLLAALPILGAAVRSLVHGRGSALARPMALALLGGAVLVVGGRHFANGWPGTGGHPWTNQGLVPGGVAAFSWATTLSITSYWAHPTALAAFPPLEVAWMVASPVAIVAVIVGMATTVRRVNLSRRVRRMQRVVVRAAAVSMTAFLGASMWWVTRGDAAPRGLFRTGAIDLVALGAMGMSLLLALWAAQRATRMTLVPAPD